MSRTKRYVPLWVKEEDRNPWIDPTTLRPYTRQNPHSQYRAKQRHLARMRGDDGRCPRWKDRWVTKMQLFRGENRILINEGLLDYENQLEDEWLDGLMQLYDRLWYEDEPMDEPEEEELPDWWFGPELNGPEEDHLYEDDLLYDPYDDYDDYGTFSIPIETFEHENAPKYEPGESLYETLDRLNKNQSQH